MAYHIKSHIVARYMIDHPSVPSSFRGFTILQISDLHERRFGYGQWRLVRAISELPCDVNTVASCGFRFLVL